YSRSTPTVSESSTQSAAQRCEGAQRVLRDCDQRGLRRVAITSIDGDHRDVVGQGQRLADRVRRMPLGTVEFIDGDQKRQVTRRKKAGGGGGEAALQPADI